MMQGVYSRPRRASKNEVLNHMPPATRIHAVRSPHGNSRYQNPTDAKRTLGQSVFTLSRRISSRPKAKVDFELRY